MGKGCAPRKGHNQEKQSKNYDAIDWSKKTKSTKSKLPQTEQPKSK
jgi:hypothetical protein